MLIYIKYFLFLLDIYLIYCYNIIKINNFKENQMKYIVYIPKNIIGEIRKIIDKEEYSNLNEFIITSLENQIILETGEKIRGELIPSFIEVPKTITWKVSKKKEYKDYSKWLSVENIDDIKTLPMPEIKDLEFPGTKYKDLWLWGQVNRIFPIKVGLRILSNMQKEKADFILLNDYHKKAGEIAKGFGYQLEKIDNQLKRKRGKRVSTALPIGKNAEKSERRYITQFLAIKRTDGILEGGMARLKFVNIQSLNEKEDLIGITKEGLEFTKLVNPILDVDLHSEKTLSDEEADFYIKHIVNRVPEELNPCKRILQIIRNGSTSLTEIDKELKKIKPEWTDVVITTQRSGALGRMNELNILNKTKIGTKVFYKIYKQLKEFFKNNDKL